MEKIPNVLPVALYLQRSLPQANQAMSLTALWAPFGLQLHMPETVDKNSEDLLMGHLCEALVELELDNTFEEGIDPLDIATLAYDLGYEEAVFLLEEGPTLLCQTYADNM